MAGRGKGSRGAGQRASRPIAQTEGLRSRKVAGGLQGCPKPTAHSSKRADRQPSLPAVWIRLLTTPGQQTALASGRRWFPGPGEVTGNSVCWKPASAGRLRGRQDGGWYLGSTPSAMTDSSGPSGTPLHHSPGVAPPWWPGREEPKRTPAAVHRSVPREAFPGVPESSRGEYKPCVAQVGAQARRVALEESPLHLVRHLGQRGPKQQYLPCPLLLPPRGLGRAAGLSSTRETSALGGMWIGVGSRDSRGGRVSLDGSQGMLTRDLPGHRGCPGAAGWAGQRPPRLHPGCWQAEALQQLQWLLGTAEL